MTGESPKSWQPFGSVTAGSVPSSAHSRGQNEKTIAAFHACLGFLGSVLGCGEVTITQMDWASANVVCKFRMEQGYGCKVTTVPSSTPTALTSVADTGVPDILTELWVNTAPAYAELVKAGKTVELTDVLSDGGVEGWWVPKYIVDAHPEAAKFPSLDALHQAFAAIPQTRDMTKGVENSLWAIKDGLKRVLAPRTQPLSWMREGTL